MKPADKLEGEEEAKSAEQEKSEGQSEDEEEIIQRLEQLDIIS